MHENKNKNQDKQLKDTSEQEKQLWPFFTWSIT